MSNGSTNCSVNINYQCGAKVARKECHTGIFEVLENKDSCEAESDNEAPRVLEDKESSEVKSDNKAARVSGDIKLEESNMSHK